MRRSDILAVILSTVDEMDKHDAALRESIKKLWPIQGPKMNSVLVPPKDGKYY